jgi:hypothetical protein
MANLIGLQESVDLLLLILFISQHSSSKNSPQFLLKPPSHELVEESSVSCYVFSTACSHIFLCWFCHDASLNSKMTKLEYMLCSYPKDYQISNI